MNARGIELLVVTDPANIYYLSGYDAWSFYVGQALLVPMDDQEPVWVGRELDRRGAALTTFLSDANLIGYGDDYVQSSKKDPMHAVAAVIHARGWERARIGVELSSYYYTAQAHHELSASLPRAELVDASLLVNWVRAIKSELELAAMREAARIVERAMRAGIEAIAEGVRECDVAAAIYQAQIAGTSEYGGEYTSSPPFIPSGERAGTPHLSWTDRPYREGQLTNLELVASRRRYHCPLGRTVVLGKPSKDVTAAAEGVVEGLTAALEVVRPGVTCEEIEAVWRRAAARYGITKDSRCGYSIGIAYPPTFGERTLSLRPGDTTVLERGMTLHLIPGIWLADWGVLISEPFVVTEGGHEPLCRLPRELIVKR
jgi:Xaa-Pro dipeptidase